MSVDPNLEMGLRELQGHLARARTITPELIIDVIARACLRFGAQNPTAKVRLLCLIESGAFVDATLGLIELDLPHWKLRRLMFDDGEWNCSLSKQLELPIELDEMAEGSHEDLPLAILSAVIEARCSSLTANEERPKTLPQVSTRTGVRRLLRQLRLMTRSEESARGECH
jgi:hypothetical protein